MAIALVVTQPFADYAKGDQITDPKTVAAILDGHSHRVVKTNVPDPAPVAQTTDASAPAALERTNDSSSQAPSPAA